MSLPAIRTRWKPLSKSGGLNSYLTEKKLPLIRTAWKISLKGLLQPKEFPFKINTHLFEGERIGKESLIRTWRKRILHWVEFYLHSTENGVLRIRTCWKEKITGSTLEFKFPLSFNTQSHFRLNHGAGSEIRTGWKRILHLAEMNSYSTENFLGLIRTPRNFFRTGWKREVDFVEERAFFSLPINTSLYINKGNE
jgi:hypothetical protein